MCLRMRFHHAALVFVLASASTCFCYAQPASSETDTLTCDSYLKTNDEFCDDYTPLLQMGARVSPQSYYNRLLLEASLWYAPSSSGVSLLGGANQRVGQATVQARRAAAILGTVILVAFLAFAGTRKAADVQTDCHTPASPTQDNSRIKRKITPHELEMHAQPEDLWIAIDSIVCDISEFAAIHPGGAEVLFDVAGRDASSFFHEVGHSEFAIAAVSSLAIGNLVEGEYHTDSARAAPERHVPSMQKLFTKEDSYNFHKMLGLFCLCHFAYRLVSCLTVMYPSGDESGFGPDFVSLGCVWAHALLQISSFRFEVPGSRVKGSPMIWEEYRAHNCVFAMRHVLSFTVSWSVYRFGWQGTIVENVALATKFVFIFLAMFLADQVTVRYREDNHESTTATMPYWDGCPMWMEMTFKNYYMFAQIQATVTLVWWTDMSIKFLVILPIQLASFLMTLVRKGLISGRVYHMIYFWSLAQVYVCWAAQFKHVFLTTVFMLVVFVLRLKGLSKWAIWVGIAAASQLLHFHLVIDFGLQDILVCAAVGLVWVAFAFCCTYGTSAEHGVRRFLEARPKAMVLIEREQLSEALFRLRFALIEGYCSGVGIGQHVRLVCPNLSQHFEDWNGKLNVEHLTPVVSRSYTPVSPTYATTLDLVVRRYAPNASQGFPHGGRASVFLTEEVSIGQELMVSGPHGHKVYLGKGIFRVGSGRVHARHCAAIVGGSGVTPALALFQQLRHEATIGVRTGVVDISIMQVTRSFQEGLPAHFFENSQILPCRLCNISTDSDMAAEDVSTPSDIGVSKHRGKLTVDLLNEHLPSPGDDVVVLVCGPRGFVVDLCQPMLAGLGYKNTVVLW